MKYTAQNILRPERFFFFSIDNSATLAQFSGHLFSIENTPEIQILLQHFDKGSKLLTTTNVLSMSMEQIL